MKTLLTLLILGILPSFVYAQTRTVELGGHKFEVVKEQNIDWFNNRVTTDRLYHVTDTSSTVIDLVNKCRDCQLYIEDMNVGGGGEYVEMLTVNYSCHFGKMKAVFLLMNDGWVRHDRMSTQPPGYYNPE